MAELAVREDFAGNVLRDVLLAARQEFDCYLLSCLPALGRKCSRRGPSTSRSLTIVAINANAARKARLGSTTAENHRSSRHAVKTQCVYVPIPCELDHAECALAEIGKLLVLVVPHQGLCWPRHWTCTVDCWLSTRDLRTPASARMNDPHLVCLKGQKQIRNARPVASCPDRDQVVVRVTSLRFRAVGSGALWTWTDICICLPA